ncbi:MAG TPA: FRG domain-containing protein [Caulobacteraceae bacterium]|jgi:hypothetical protein|nr:FRG domain-containing protein [Caulobacteraceae bacterium]
MDGQWIGRFEGTHEGVIVIDLDDLGTNCDGVAYIFPNDQDVPGTIARIRTPNKNKKVTFNTTTLNTLDKASELIPPHLVQSVYPNFVFPKIAEVTLEWSDTKLNVQWKTDIGTVGAANISRSTSTTSRTPAKKEINSWAKFKEYAHSLRPYSFIYRGQPEPDRLRTAFHRTKRTNLLRFAAEDIPALHRHLSARTSHVFDLTKALENGAFHNLIQHHGYPTPLLDWTYSPFVAAYFAFLRQPALCKGTKVRIFAFDKETWVTTFNQLQRIGPARPHFSVSEFLGIGNERMTPQQALSTITNVDDIEAYIQEREQERSVTYLTAIDLPRSERVKALQELSVMGITAGSLFPGLDGACEELRGRFFGF